MLLLLLRTAGSDVLPSADQALVASFCRLPTRINHNVATEVPGRGMKFKKQLSRAASRPIPAGRRLFPEQSKASNRRAVSARRRYLQQLLGLRRRQRRLQEFQPDGIRDELLHPGNAARIDRRLGNIVAYAMDLAF